MKVIKIYQKPDKAEFYVFVRAENDEVLLNYPIEMPDTKRSAKWLKLNEIYIDWIKEFA
jgi:hypothetical protein